MLSKDGQRSSGQLLALRLLLHAVLPDRAAAEFCGHAALSEWVWGRRRLLHDECCNFGFRTAVPNVYFIMYALVLPLVFVLVCGLALGLLHCPLSVGLPGAPMLVRMPSVKLTWKPNIGPCKDCCSCVRILPGFPP